MICGFQLLNAFGEENSLDLQQHETHRRLGTSSFVASICICKPRTTDVLLVPLMLAAAVLRMAVAAVAKNSVEGSGARGM